MKKTKEQKAITLVALIITIIVLLILAVVAIRAVTGDGILGYAQNSVDEYEAGADKENAMLGNYLAKLEENIPGGSGTNSGDEEPEEFDGVVISDASYFNFDGATVTGLSDEGIAEIEKIEGQDVKLIIPATNEGVNITNIGENAFSEYGANNNRLMIEMPSITTVGYCAFDRCVGLYSINMPNVITVGEEAFYACENLTNVKAPKVTTIEEMGFYNCSSLTSIDLPEAITLIGAFCDCSNLTSIKIPKATTITGSFTNCVSLTSIEIPHVTSLSDSTFGFCKSLNSIVMPKVTSIGAEVFYFTNFKSLKLPNVTEIGDYAFYKSPELTKIEIPSTVTTMGGALFVDCTKLKDIYVSGIGEEEASEIWGLNWLSGAPEDITIHWNTSMPE